jgi:hypothetical protein
VGGSPVWVVLVIIFMCACLPYQNEALVSVSEFVQVQEICQVSLKIDHGAVGRVESRPFVVDQWRLVWLGHPHLVSKVLQYHVY